MEKNKEKKLVSKGSEKKKAEKVKVDGKKGKVKKESKKPALPWVMIGLGVGLLVIWGVVVILVMQISKKALGIQALRTQIIATEMSGQDQQILAQALADTVEERKRLVDAFPDEEQMLKFIDLIDEIKESDVEVVKFSVDSDVPTKIGNNPSFLPITLLFKGSDGDVDAALTKIVDSPYFINPVTLAKSWDAEGDVVVMQTQFYLYVSSVFSDTPISTTNNRRR
jgi:hypothetical protein